MNENVTELFSYHPNVKLVQFTHIFLYTCVQVLEALKGSTATRPAIFAMSNPTTNGTVVQSMNFACCAWVANLPFSCLVILTLCIIYLMQPSALLKKHSQSWVKTSYLRVEAHSRMLILVREINTSYALMLFTSVCFKILKLIQGRGMLLQKNNKLKNIILGSFHLKVLEN